jgi:predicted PurR-regulated permease PerM
MPDDDQTAPQPVPPADVIAAARQTEAERGARPQKPEWVDRFVWESLGKVVATGLLVALGVVVVFRAEHLIFLLVVSVFFAAAMIPAVQHLHERRGWRPGAAVGAIYAALVLLVLAMVLLLIPAITEFAGQVADNGDDWMQSVNDWTEKQFGVTVLDQPSARDAATRTGEALSGWTDKVLGLASSGLGIVFDLATVGLFTFYLTANNQRIRRSLLSRMPPHRQRVYSWISDTALQQTGGYFYSRLLLMIINGTLFFAVMVAVGMPVSYALPLSLFEGFVAEFIPAVGTYIGAAVPILVTLGDQGLASALILLGWTLVYQQVENYWLSPRLSARTMELNGGVAFGAALAGGAIAGPMGAFMALPVAALITATVSNIGHTYDIVGESTAGATATTGPTTGPTTEPDGQH